MELTIPHAIVNASVNLNPHPVWYPMGTKRLEKSLNYHGETADFLTWENKWPVSGYDETNPYNIKISCIEQAVKLGYKRILWADCSFYAIKHTMPMWDEINHYGYFFWRSGFTCDQVCSDKCLDYFGVTRDKAAQWQDCSTSLVGINLDNPFGLEFWQRWKQAAKDGMFDGSRTHDIRDSADPRFLHARQDQQCASIIINQMELTMRDAGYLCSVYNHNNMPDTTCFVMMGL